MRRIVIKHGCAAGFADEMSLPLVNAQTRRVSTIVPQNVLLRCTFAVLRSLVADSSRVAAWTRTWRCVWLVRIARATYGPFRNRSEAIKFEKGLIQGSGVMEHYLENSKCAPF